MAGADVTAVIEAVLKDDQFQASIKKMVDGTKDAADNTKSKFKEIQESIEKNWMAIAAAAYGAFETIKKTLEAVEIAAKFEEQTEAIKEQFGVAADDIIESMSRAAKGTVSNVELMKLASRAMALGVTKDVNELGKMMEYAEIKSKALGISTQEAFSKMVDGIGKQNPRMLKELGFSAKAFKDVEDGATGLMSKQEMLDVVMRDAEVTITKYGNANLSTADKMDQVKVGFENTKLKLGQELMPTIDRFIPYVSGLAKAFELIPGPLKIMGIAALALIPALLGLYAAAGPLGLALAAIAGVAVFLAADYGRLEKATEELTKAQDKLFESAATQAFATQNYALNAFKNTMKGATDEALKLSEAMLKQGKYLDANGKFLQAANREQEAYAKLQLKIIDQELTARQRQQDEIEKANKKAAEEVKKTQDERAKFVMDLDKREFEGKLNLINKYLSLVGLTREQEKTLNNAKYEEIKKIEDAITEKLMSENDRRTAKIVKATKQEIENLKIIREERLKDAKGNAEKELQINKDYQDKLQAVSKKGMDGIKTAAAENALGIAKAVVGALKNIQGMVENILSAEVTSFQTGMNHMAEIRSGVESKRRDEDYEANKASLEKEIADAKAAGDSKTQKYKESQLQRLDEDNRYAKEKEAVDKVMREKERTAKMEAFVANKILRIAEATIEGAIAFIRSIPDPLMMVLTAASVASQIALIASTPMPAMAKGGRAKGGMTLVGEEGPELVMLPAGANVLPASATSALMSGMPSAAASGNSVSNINNSRSSSVNQNFSLVANGVQNPIDFINRAKRQFGSGVFEARR